MTFGCFSTSLHLPLSPIHRNLRNGIDYPKKAALLRLDLN